MKQTYIHIDLSDLDHAHIFGPPTKTMPFPRYRRCQHLEPGRAGHLCLWLIGKVHVGMAESSAGSRWLRKGLMVDGELMVDPCGDSVIHDELMVDQING